MADLSRTPILTAETVRAWFEYDAERGILRPRTYRKDAPERPPLGFLNRGGYRVWRHNGTLHQVHRVIWLFVHGRWPEGQIDHINGDKRDNRIANLRLATAQQNRANVSAQTNGTSGFKGVSWCKGDQRWHARIMADGKRYFLGGYITAEEAARAYDDRAIALHGSFARTNFAPPLAPASRDGGL